MATLHCCVLGPGSKELGLFQSEAMARTVGCDITFTIVTMKGQNKSSLNLKFACSLEFGGGSS